MKQESHDPYPVSDFLRDFGQWHSFPVGNGDNRAAAVFPKLYPDAFVCSYRLKRLRCVVAAIQTNIEQLVQDGILKAEGTRVHLANRIVVALHNYYGGIDESLLDMLPPPDWIAVMQIYDQTKET